MATVLGALNFGDTVKINVGGVAYDFIVANKGRPSMEYDASCDGVWLVMKDCYTLMSMASKSYVNSSVHTYLNDTFFGLLDSNVQSAIKEVKLPYCDSTGSSGEMQTGANGFSAKVFLPSGIESYVGTWISSSYSSMPVEGARLKQSLKSTVPNYNGTAVDWWTRTPSADSSTQYWRISTSGSGDDVSYSQQLGIRPAFILPFEFSVKDGECITDGKTLETTSLGSTVKLNVDGVARDFIVVHKGLPASYYHKTCDGVWLLMKDIYADSTKKFTNGELELFEEEFIYEDSLVQEYLTGTFVNKFDTDIKECIKEARIPLWSGTGVDGELEEDGDYSSLAQTVFLLSYNEIANGTKSNNPGDGAVLSYFVDTTDAANAIRIAYYNGTAKEWVTRSPELTETQWIFYVRANGSIDKGSYSSDTKGAIRPALILPYGLSIKDGFVVTSSFSGNATIDGVSKELSGAHANVGGVWKEVSETYMNVGGVWKPMA